MRTCSQQNGGTGADTQNACTGGGGFACYDFAPWAVSEDLAYGFVAFNRGGCGTCYELTFTGESNSQPDDPGSKAICGKRMIVQVVNIGGIQGNQFDIMIPGGGVGDFDACSRQWNAGGNLGERYGGLQLACQKNGNNDIENRKTCTQNACNQLFSRSELSSLKAGCNWSVDWLQTADNPKMRFRQVDCPQELRQKSGR